MLPMTDCKRGDIVLVQFVFSDESGVKRRPALVVSTDLYHRGRQEAIVAAITSNMTRMLIGDYKLRSWNKAGLLSPSAVTGIIRTVKQAMIRGRLGALSAGDLRAVQRNLRNILAL